MSYAKYSGLSSSSSGVPIYSTISAFPVTATTGSLGVAADTGNLYEFNGTSWVLIGGPGAALSLGNLDAQAGTAQGAALVGGVLSMQSASATEPGLVNTNTQSFAGTKTFTSDIRTTGIDNLSGTQVLDVADVVLIGGSGRILVNNNLLEDNNGYHAVDWKNDLLTDSNNALSLNWLNRYLYNAAGGVLLNWSGTTQATMPALGLYGSNTGTISLLTQVNAGTYNFNFPTTAGKSGQVLPSAGGGSSAMTWTTPATGTVTAVSVATANGLAGTSSGGATPALTLSTTVTGVVKGNGTSLSAATAGTDYSAGTSALGTGILKSTTATGALTIAVAGDFPTLNQNTTGTAANITATSNSTLTTLSSLSLPTSQLSGNISLTTQVTGTLPVLNGGTGVTTSTGTGSVVLSNSPTLVTPALGTPASGTLTNATGLPVSGIAAIAANTLIGNNTGSSATPTALTASQVNTLLGSLINPMTTLGDIIYENSTPAPARLAGNTTSTINFLSQTGTGSASAAPVWTPNIPSANVQGTTAGGNATSGYIGEFVSSNPGSPVTPAASGSQVNVTSISLTAGDWDVEGMMETIAGATSSFSALAAGISTTSNNYDSTNKGGINQLATTIPAGMSQYMPTGVRRINISSTTTVYLVGFSSYAALGGATFGTDSYIRARRVR